MTSHQKLSDPHCNNQSEREPSEKAAGTCITPFWCFHKFMISFDFHDNSEGRSQHYCYLTNGEGEAKEGPELTQGCTTIQEIESFQVLILPFAHPWLTDSICCGSPGQSYKWAHCMCTQQRGGPGDTFICVPLGSYPTSPSTFERERHHRLQVFVYSRFWNHY